MTQIQPFIFPTTGQSVRTLLVDGEPWFVAADVAAILGYRDAFNATRNLDEDERGTHLVSTPSGDQLATIISEPGLFALIMRSNAIGAREFRRWVNHEVLPSIRKTGSYSISQLSRKDLARMVIEAEEAIEAEKERADRAEFQVLELAPAARAWDSFREAAGDYSMREAAQILDRDPSISTGQNRLFRFLRDEGWIDRTGMPYQVQIDRGRLALKSTSWDNPKTGEEQTGRQVRVTVKGVEALHKRLHGTADVAALLSEEVAA